jgi:hypothetical protein
MDARSVLRQYSKLRAVKMCLELECSVVWTDSDLVCPACGSREVVLLETYVNRKAITRRVLR